MDDGKLVQRVTHTDFNNNEIVHHFDEMGRVTAKVPQADPLPDGWVPVDFT